MDTAALQQLRESLERKKQSLSEWLESASAEEQRTRTGPLGEPGVREHLQSIESALKKAEENTLGVCDVCHDYVETSRLEMDYTACVCLDHLSGTERTRLEADLELSQKVQRALLPHEVPGITALEIAAFSQPAHIVGGDYFDFLRMRDGSHALVIADVMGKGMAASLLMASLQASLHIIAPESSGPAEVVARLNHLFCHNIRLTKFVTFFVGQYDEPSGNLSYCNAGHNPPLLLRSDGAMERLLPTGAAIGLVEHAEFLQSEVTLRKGDTLLLYTDGVVESWNPRKELFGQERLEAHLGESGNFNPQQLIQSLRNRIQAFTEGGSPTDDTTIVAIRRT
jgi:phosphoserine phosphatase RsbU/P